MADVSLEWQDDFEPDATGDLLVIDGDNEVRQRLERRLFTHVQGYIWHPEYGAGLTQKVGAPWTVEQIRAICQAQLALEASVAISPPAKLQVAADPNNPGQVNIGIQYWDAVAGVSVSFTITA